MLLNILLITYGIGAVVMLFILAGVILNDYRAGVVSRKLYGWIAQALIVFTALWPVVAVYLLLGFIIEKLKQLKKIKFN